MCRESNRQTRIYNQLPESCTNSQKYRKDFYGIMLSCHGNPSCITGHLCKIPSTDYCGIPLTTFGVGRKDDVIRIVVVVIESLYCFLGKEAAVDNVFMEVLTLDHVTSHAILTLSIWHPDKGEGQKILPIKYHYTDGTRASWCLKSLAILLFVQLLARANS